MKAWHRILVSSTWYEFPVSTNVSCHFLQLLDVICTPVSNTVHKVFHSIVYQIRLLLRGRNILVIGKILKPVGSPKLSTLPTDRLSLPSGCNSPVTGWNSRHSSNGTPRAIDAIVAYTSLSFLKASINLGS